MNLALFSSDTSQMKSPAAGMLGMPTTWTASPGRATLRLSPLSSCRLFTFAQSSPMTRREPILRVPCLTIIVIALRPLLFWQAYNTIPSANPSSIVFSSLVSSRMSSESSSTFWPVLALMCTTGMSPPLGSMFSPASQMEFSVASTSALGRSILLMATMVGILSLMMRSITSWVCFLTPSVEETMSTTRSVTLAPLLRMLEKASWPGVSMKVIFCPWQVMWKAPIFWVIPPTSPWAMLEFLRQSMRVVLPWSTCPMMVMTGDFLVQGSSFSVFWGSSIPLMMLSMRTSSLLTKLVLGLSSCLRRAYSLMFSCCATIDSDSSLGLPLTATLGGGGLMVGLGAAKRQIFCCRGKSRASLVIMRQYYSTRKGLIYSADSVAVLQQDERLPGQAGAGGAEAGQVRPIITAAGTLPLQGLRLRLHGGSAPQQRQCLLC